jgi:hypothetical protein
MSKKAAVAGGASRTTRKREDFDGEDDSSTNTCVSVKLPAVFGLSSSNPHFPDGKKVVAMVDAGIVYVQPGNPSKCPTAINMSVVALLAYLKSGNGKETLLHFLSRHAVAKMYYGTKIPKSSMPLKNGEMRPMLDSPDERFKGAVEIYGAESRYTAVPGLKIIKFPLKTQKTIRTFAAKLKKHPVCQSSHHAVSKEMVGFDPTLVDDDELPLRACKTCYGMIANARPSQHALYANVQKFKLLTRDARALVGSCGLQGCSLVMLTGLAVLDEIMARCSAVSPQLLNLRPSDVQANTVCALGITAMNTPFLVPVKANRAFLRLVDAWDPRTAASKLCVNRDGWQSEWNPYYRAQFREALESGAAVIEEKPGGRNANLRVTGEPTNTVPYFFVDRRTNVIVLGKYAWLLKQIYGGRSPVQHHFRVTLAPRTNDTQLFYEYPGYSKLQYVRADGASGEPAGTFEFRVNPILNGQNATFSYIATVAMNAAVAAKYARDNFVQRACEGVDGGAAKAALYNAYMGCQLNIRCEIRGCPFTAPTSISTAYPPAVRAALLLHLEKLDKGPQFPANHKTFAWFVSVANSTAASTVTLEHDAAFLSPLINEGVNVAEAEAYLNAPPDSIERGDAHFDAAMRAAKTLVNEDDETRTALRDAGAAVRSRPLFAGFRPDNAVREYRGGGGAAARD